jgi:hypothetical protein
MYGLSWGSSLSWTTRSAMLTEMSPIRSRSVVILRPAMTRRKSLAAGWRRPMSLVARFPVQLVGLDPLREGLSREPEHANRGMFQARRYQPRLRATQTS